MSADFVYDTTKGLMQDDPAGATAGANSALAKIAELDLAAAGTAGSAGTESLGIVLSPAVVEILSVALVNGTTAVTADASNYANADLYSRVPAGGGSATLIAQASTTLVGTGSLASRQAVNVPVVAGKSRLAAGAVVTCNWTKAASGVVTGTAKLMIRFREVNV